MKILPIISLLGLAIAASASAAPNAVDLSAYGGNFKGKAQVDVASSAKYKGDAKIHGIVPAAAKSVRMKIKASVKSGSDDVPVNNELQFRKSGKFVGKELAPGVSGGDQKFTGTYKAATNGDITFKGRFQVGTAKGTFEGTATAGPNGMKVTYALTIKGNDEPTYTYTYSGKK